MIYCPACGTANRSGSRFCNECGIRFEPRAQKCPQCATLNPPDGQVCIVCGSSLPLLPGTLPDSGALAAAEEVDVWASAQPAGTVPAWLSDIPAPLVAGLSGETPAGDRLAAGLESGGPEPPEPVQTGGVGAGLLGDSSEALPAPALLARPPSAATGGALEAELLFAGADQAHLFAEIVGPPSPVASQVVAQPVAGWRSGLPHWFLYALLLAAVALPLLVGAFDPGLLRHPILEQISFQRNRTLLPLPAVVDLYAAIESLERGDPVLVAFDYDPATTGEMEPVARAIVRHLMDRGARILAVSLLPAGPATAQRVLDEVAAHQPGSGGAYGLDYLNLGYVPGQAAAVRLLGPSLAGALPADFYGEPSGLLPVMDGVGGVGSLALIVDLAATHDSLRWWIEQASAPNVVPLGAGVSAAAEPLVRPYYETDPRQLAGVVSGVAGAAMYERLLDSAAPEADPGDQLRRQQLDVQLTGGLVLLFAIIAGNGVYLLRLLAGKKS